MLDQLSGICWKWDMLARLLMLDHPNLGGVYGKWDTLARLLLLDHPK